MFASKPTTWQVVRWDGIVAERGLDKESAEDALIFWTGGHIRPAVQHNEHNPILEAFRADLANLPDYHEGDFLLMLDRWHASWCEEPAAREYATDAQITHARRVLERLTRLAA